MTMFQRVQIVLILLCTASVVLAQVPRDPCELSTYKKGCYLSIGKSAERNGKPREAWEYYMRALREGGRVASAVDPRTGRTLVWAEDHAANQEIIEKLITLRNKIQPHPQISGEAYAAMQRGIAAVDNATSPKDFVAAEESFEAAVMLAPWWPDALLNLAYTRETIGAYAYAIQSFRLYLLAAPNADDSDKVRAKIEELKRNQ